MTQALRVLHQAVVRHLRNNRTAVITRTFPSQLEGYSQEAELAAVSLSPKDPVHRGLQWQPPGLQEVATW